VCLADFIDHGRECRRGTLTIQVSPSPTDDVN